MQKLKIFPKNSSQFISLILASQSAGRRSVLNNANIAFIVDPAHIDENKFPSDSIEQLVEILALEKAKVVAKRHTNAIILGADTMVVCNELPIGKPKDKDDATKILQLLSGTTHQVYTGIAVIDLITKKITKTHVTTNVTFRKLTKAEIETYLLKDTYIGKAGAYSAQMNEENFISKIDGSLTNVIGLPLEKLLEILKKWNYKLS
jgi:septum formation protein